jgi:mono/diheme cytochrome c family protein
MEILDNRLKWALLIVSALTLVMLVASALNENVFAEWRQLRLKYADILEEKAVDEKGRDIADLFEIGIDHNVMPALGTIDRCISCHVGLQDPRMEDQDQPFRTHPGTILSSHPPESFGCTICHQGQGRATESEDAHVGHHWPYPMLESPFLYASCAQCHDDAVLYSEDLLFAKTYKDYLIPPAAQKLWDGKRFVEEKGCLGCHKLNGTGGILGPDITYVGDKTIHDFDFSHFGKDEPREVVYWLKKHFLEPGEASPGTVMPDMGLDEAQAEILTAYVLSLKHREVPAAYRPKQVWHAPEPESGKSLYASMCSSCHGEFGEESDVPGIRTPALNNRDSLAVAGDDYYRFIIAHGRSGSNMPGWSAETGGLSEQQIDSIVEYIRGWESPGASLRNVSARQGDPAMGEVYYTGLCRNCHGGNGEGGIGNALNSSTFLSIASDQFLAETIIHGRPGTAMASWKHLPAQAVSDILAFIRDWQSESATFEDVRTLLHNESKQKLVQEGTTLYRGNCAGCHGNDGEGGIGLVLNTSDLVSTANVEFLYHSITRGRPTTAMPAWNHFSARQVTALIRYLQSWKTQPAIGLDTAPGGGDYALGEVHYKVSCLPCHGEEGRGGVGPQIANPALLKAASNDLLYHWIGHGRAGTAMKGFLAKDQGVTTLKPDQISDVIAYLRYQGSRDERPILRTGIGDPHVGGQIFEGSCSGCHGTEGQGSSGPQLNNATFLRSASDGFLLATIALGRSDTPMRSMIHGGPGIGQVAPAQVQDIVAFMRLWDLDSSWQRPRPVAEMSQRAIDAGAGNFTNYCAGCHGPAGKGINDGPEYVAPALNNPEFLDAVSDGFLLATIARGRSNTPMRPFGLGTGGIARLGVEEISDIVSYIRTWQEQYAPQGE